MAPKVIVFGATGQVGSRTAIRAQSLGATVYLASRSASKPVPDGLRSTKRVEADLADAASVSQAVHTTGATRAFVYVPLGSPVDMKATFAALKSAGVTFVVCLSTDVITGKLEGVPPSQYINYQHAQAELNMRAVFGSDCVAVRPGHFVTNIFRYKSTLASGEVQVIAPDAIADWLDPNDIGDVCGSLLVDGKGGEPISLRGPEPLSQKDALAQIANVLGVEAKFTKADDAQALHLLTKVNGFPEPVARQVLQSLSKAPTEPATAAEKHSEATANVDRYAGHKATTLREWTERNKSAFLDN